MYCTYKLCLLTLSKCNAIQQFARVLTEIIILIVLLLFLRYFRPGMQLQLLKKSCSVFLFVNAETWSMHNVNVKELIVVHFERVKNCSC